MGDEREPDNEIDPETDRLTISEVAILLRVHRKAVERLVYGGRLLAFNLNERTVRFHCRDALAFVQANTLYLGRAGEASRQS